MAVAMLAYDMIGVAVAPAAGAGYHPRPIPTAEGKDAVRMAYFPRNVLATPPEPVRADALDWEETSCLLCGGKRWQTLLEAQDTQAGTDLWFAVVQCLDCGLCFTNPRPSSGWLERFYPADYRPHQVKSEEGRAKREEGAVPAVAAPDPLAGLLQHGLTLLEQLAAASRSPQPSSSAGSRTSPALVARDETTGQPYLKLPMPSPEVLDNVLRAVGTLLERLRG